MMTVGRLERFFTDGWNRHDVDLLMTLRLIGARHFRLWMLWTRGLLRYTGLSSATEINVDNPIRALHPGPSEVGRA